MTRVAIYARVSTLDQEPENQLAELRRYVEARRWTAAEYVDHGVSGAKDRSAKPAGDGWTAKCPAHEDQRASLSINVGDDGRTLLHCHAGCDIDVVLAAAHLERRDLFQTNGKGKSRIVAEYDYRDENGKLLYQVCRFEPKDFLTATLRRARQLDLEHAWDGTPCLSAAGASRAGGGHRCRR